MTMKKFPITATLLIVISAFFFSCSLIGEEDSCVNIKGYYELEKIGDEYLPYIAYHIDSNNNSQVTKGTQMFFTSSWDATLYNTVTSDGVTSEKKFRSTGSYTCEDGVVSILNEEKEASGTGYIDGKTISIGVDSGYDYVGVRQ